MKITYQIARWQGATLGVEMRGPHPQAEWLIGWLKDHLTRDPRLARGAGEAAGTLYALARDAWPHQAVLVEVARRDGLGAVRIEHLPDASEPSGPRPH